MNREEIINLVSFLILMQGGEGIMGKAPSYILEKQQTAGPYLLDNDNKAILDAWIERWEIHLPE